LNVLSAEIQYFYFGVVVKMERDEVVMQANQLRSPAATLAEILTGMSMQDQCGGGVHFQLALSSPLCHDFENSTTMKIELQ
jgi:2-succinyl-5-enolpyruvyl-6-hydroxy-3-cyclohexene-1-carboxylate synthase